MSDAVYWRTLAEERGREIEVLRARLREALVVDPARCVPPAAGWMREPDRMEPLHELRAADAAPVLGELWARVDADR